MLIIAVLMPMTMWPKVVILMLVDVGGDEAEAVVNGVGGNVSEFHDGGSGSITVVVVMAEELKGNKRWAGKKHQNSGYNIYIKLVLKR